MKKLIKKFKFSIRFLKLSVLLAIGLNLLEIFQNDLKNLNDHNLPFFQLISLVVLLPLLYWLNQQHKVITNVYARRRAEVLSTLRKKLTLEHSPTLDETIAKHFIEWNLTKTEVIIGVLLLDGLSNKEIARNHTSSEKTVREHVSSILRKSGLNTRAKFIGYFISKSL